MRANPANLRSILLIPSLVLPDSTGIFISSNLFGSIFQIASLPVVILAPLGAVSLLWNAFFARLILGDVFSPWMALSTLCIAGGAVMIAVFGIVPEPTRSLEDLLLLFNRPTFIVYFSLLGVFTVVSLAIVSALLVVDRLSPNPPSRHMHWSTLPRDASRYLMTPHHCRLSLYQLQIPRS